MGQRASTLCPAPSPSDETRRIRAGCRKAPAVLAVIAVLIAFAPDAGAAVSASVVASQLQVSGDATDDTIRLRLLAGDATRVEVLDGATSIGTFDRATFATILVYGLGGQDTIVIDDVNGAFTDDELTTIDGGDGGDTLTGGREPETLRGGAGNDAITGGAGTDRLEGGDGEDTLTGGPAAPNSWERIFGGPGNDTMVWNAGPVEEDGWDWIQGDAGTDTLEFNGGDSAEIMAATARHDWFWQGPFFTCDVGNVSIALSTTEQFVINAGGGSDRVSAGTGLAQWITITMNGGEGNDVLAGSDGADALNGGPGDDIITGGAGLDSLDGGEGDDTLTGGPGAPSAPSDFEQIRGGPGDDTIVWNPGDISWGDGNDRADGGDGTDRVVFNGTNDTEVMAATVVGGSSSWPVAFTCDVSAVRITIDIAAAERLIVNGAGGDDTFTIGPGLGSLIAPTLDGGAGADVFSVPASSPSTIVGGTGIDALTFDALDRLVSVGPADIAVSGIVVVTHATLEAIDVLNAQSGAPTVTILSPTPAPVATATSSFITVTGTAADPGGAVQSVTWSNERGGSGTAVGTTAWTALNLPLTAGTNVITVIVEDASGNRTTDTITITVSQLTYMLAEGATGAFFDFDVLIANPTTANAPVLATFLTEHGTTVTQSLTVNALSQAALHVDQIPGLETRGGVSTVITSTNAIPLAVERTMFWDSQYFGSHGGTAVDGPRSQWLFAEGSEGFFSTFVLLANPGAATASVTLRFLREGATPVTRVVAVAPASRVTVACGLIPELVHRSFSIVVDSNVPIIAERSMYFWTTRFLDGGHESAGVAEAATRWFLAEGATGPFFETFILVGNPNAAVANVTLTFLTDTGTTVARPFAIPANGRLTVNVETQDPALDNVAVSTTVVSDQPVIAERTMYWPGPPANWYESHNSFGTTAVGMRWALAEGRVGLDHGFQTYILLANPNTTTAAQVRVTFLRADGTTIVRTCIVNPTTRFSMHVNSAAPELVNESFGALIEVTNDVGVSAERAMYSDALGFPWMAGTHTLATRLP